MLTKIRENLIKAMKAQNKLEISVLRVLMSNIQSAETISGKSLTEDQAISIVKKLINQNNEEINSRSGNFEDRETTAEQKAALLSQYADNITQLQAENVILAAYLPDFLSADKIKDILQMDAHWGQIKSAKNLGGAIGVAMKLLKDCGKVEGQTVKDVVTAIYASGERLSVLPSNTEAELLKEAKAAGIKVIDTGERWA
jgi:uncharacterized protein YqeY